jgi:protein tyrosine kinase
MTDFDRLLSLADAIARGEPVDPAGDTVNAAPGEARKQPWAPEDLEKLVAALRRIDQTGRDLLAPLNESSGQSPGRWAHLAIFGAIGAGAFGSIYRAYDPRLGVDVSLELLSPSEPAESVKRFLDVTRRLVRLRHLNVVRCYGVDEWAGCAGMWTELVKGQTLEQLALSGGQLQAGEATAIGRALCHAAAVIRQSGLPHTRITARNVVRDASGRVVLIEPISRAPREGTEADVVRDIGGLISVLTTARGEETARNLGIAAPLAAVIQRATSTDASQGIATLDALDSALEKATTPGADSLQSGGLRSLWRALTALTRGVTGEQRRS